jgi:hypothetical protein
MVKMNLEAVRTQTAQIKAYCQELRTGAEQLQITASAVALDPGISGATGDSVKNYLSSMYPAIGRAIILHADSIETANQAYLDGYIATCGDMSLDSEDLEEFIAKYDRLIDQFVESKESQEQWYRSLDLELQELIRYDYEESQRILSNSIMQNDKERAIFKQKLETLLAFDAQSLSYFTGVGESEALLNEGLTLLGGDPATGKVGSGSWNGQGFTPIVSDWQQRVNDQWTKRVERQEQARAAEFEQAAQGRTYQRVQLASGAYQWLWVKDSGKITQEDLQFNEKYADYLAILNAPEENMVDEYYQNMLEELRTGINTKTGKPLTRLEKAQRWSTVASFVAVLAIGSYYSVKGLTGTKTTAKQPKSMTKATGPKAKLPSDTTQGRQLKVKKADIPKGKNRSIVAPKKASGATGTVWDDIKGTQPVIEGTSIPKSFEMTVNGEKFWVNPNGTKHMVEYSTRNLSHGRKLTEQQLLTSLQASTAEAVAKGYKYNVPIKVGNWELIFSPPRQAGQLPVIKHAQYIP